VSAAFALVEAHAAGVGLEVNGEKLIVRASSAPPQTVLDQLRRHKAEVIELLRAECYAVVRYVNDHFQMSPLGQCVHCGGKRHPGDPFVFLFVGEDRADIHTSCHPAWVAEQEAEARVALGFERPKAGKSKQTTKQADRRFDRPIDAWAAGDTPETTLEQANAGEPDGI
jgi:hypothetical protein